MKVVLVQLPVPDNRFTNLPLAIGYLKAMADATHLPGLEVELLTAPMQNRAGDALLLDTILAHDPDLIGFSLYTWNSSRALGLARALKRRAPEVLLLGGGPEVNHDSEWVLNSPEFDFLVLGEGERTFVELLHALIREREQLTEVRGLGRRSPTGEWVFGPAQPALNDVNSVPSAYLSGALDGQMGRFMSIELSRWCPSKCTFCYYGRQDLPRGGKRYFDLSRVRQEIEFGRAHGVEQVHFVEANFNTLPQLPQLYDLIQESGANHSLNFYAELRGEAIDLAQARRLAECNFGTVEVGLQSAVPEVLARVRRKNHLPRLVQGVHNLRAEGIEVFLDVILGLPGETAQTFERSLAFMKDNTLDPFDLFHLQLLPGTQLKSEAVAGQHGMCWQAAPPYFVLETADLPFEELARLRRQVLLAKGLDPAQVAGLPQPGPFALTELDDASALSPTEGIVERVILDLTAEVIDLTGLTELARHLGSEVTVWLKLGAAIQEALAQAAAALQTLSEPNPSGLWQLFAQTDRPLTLTETKELTEAISHEEGYLDRLAVFAQAEQSQETRARWPSINFYQVLPYQPGPPPANTVWHFRLDETRSVAEWQSRLQEAMDIKEVGVYLSGSEAKSSIGRWKALLTDLDLATPNRLWLADPTLAAGRAVAEAEDSSETLSSLDYPLTARLQNGHLTYHQPARARLERAAIAYQLAVTPKTLHEYATI